jgi:hypothetical protein
MAKKNARRKERYWNRIYCRGLENYINNLKISLISNEPGRLRSISLTGKGVTAILFFLFTFLGVRLLDISN